MKSCGGTCVSSSARYTRRDNIGLSKRPCQPRVCQPRVRITKRTLTQKLGLLGVVSLLSYTAAGVLLSIISLSVIIAAGAKDRRCRSYGICAGVALGMMLTGALGIKLVPAAYFGVAERFSVFAATGFNAALGLHLFCTAAEANYKENENAKQSLSPSA